MTPDEKKLIEAALFMSPTPVPLSKLAKLIGVSALGYVKEKVKELKKEYDKNNNAIEIVEEDNHFYMTVRKEYVPYVKDFAKEAELSRPALRALGYISKHNAILKSDMVKKLGVWVYPAVKELIEKNFIIAKHAGRSKRLYLSKKFKEYFGQ
ncbi:SMC-Scp complex subunit ScpB [Candidatus Micrarchaeota archaeon]|nr:SMC-Scp complex subunit ScpB [Candidatus Micrarchaeota archaeon]